MLHNRQVNVVKGKKGFQPVNKKTVPKEVRVLPTTTTNHPTPVGKTNDQKVFAEAQVNIRVRIFEKFKQYESMCNNFTVPAQKGYQRLGIETFLPSREDNILIVEKIGVMAKEIGDDRYADTIIVKLPGENSAVFLQKNSDLAKKYNVFVDENLENFYWVNEDGFVHREDKPAHINLQSGGGSFTWVHNGLSHNVKGPYYVHFGVEGVLYKGWSVYGETSYHAGCEKIFQQSLTNEEWYNLCSEEDGVVRALANAHPDCPPQWKVMMQLGTKGQK